MEIEASDRAYLRQFLVDRFSLDELKDLAFDLNVNFQLFSHNTTPALSRELIAFVERRKELSLLVEKVLSQRPDEKLSQLLAKLPIADGIQTKVQIVIDKHLLEGRDNIQNELAMMFNCKHDEIVLIGAVFGTMRLLIGLPRSYADNLVTLNPHELADGKYHVGSVESFNDLDQASQYIWQYIAKNHLPIQHKMILIPSIHWNDAVKEWGQGKSPIQTMNANLVSRDSVAATNMNNYLEFLREQITLSFSKIELKQMCFTLGIDWEEVESNSRSNTIINILSYVERRSELDALIKYCKNTRPNSTWNIPQATILITEPSNPPNIPVSAYQFSLLRTLVDEIEQYPSGRSVLGNIFSKQYELQEQKITVDEFADYILSLLNQNILKISVAKQFLIIIGYDVKEADKNFILVNFKGDSNDRID